MKRLLQRISDRIRFGPLCPKHLGHRQWEYETNDEDHGLIWACALCYLEGPKP